MASLEEQKEANRGALRVASIALVSALAGGIVTSGFTYLSLAQQFANQRSAQIDDTRRGTYIEYLQIIQTSYQADAGTVDEQQLRTKEAVVQLLAGEEVRAIVPDLTNAALDGSDEQYIDARDRFIEAAQREREEAAEVIIFPWS